MRHSSARTLVDTGLVRAWLWSALLWLLAFAVLGLLLAVKFNYPDFLGGLSWLTIGRLRPAHVDGMVFGVYSTAALGLLYYYVPMLCARPMVAAAVGWWAFYALDAAHSADRRAGAAVLRRAGRHGRGAPGLLCARPVHSVGCAAGAGRAVLLSAAGGRQRPVLAPAGLARLLAASVGVSSRGRRGISVQP